MRPLRRLMARLESASASTSGAPGQQGSAQQQQQGPPAGVKLEVSESWGAKFRVGGGCWKETPAAHQGSPTLTVLRPRAKRKACDAQQVISYCMPAVRAAGAHHT